MLLASYVFYCFSGVGNLCYIAFTTVSTYLITRQLQGLKDAEAACLKERRGEMSREERKAYKEQAKKKQWKWLLACLILNIGMLAVVKYTNFAIYNINGILGLVKSSGRLSFLELVCRRLAELKGIAPDECSIITQGNGRRFFHIQE